MFHVYQTIVASLIDIVQIIELMLTFLIDIDHMRALWIYRLKLLSS